MSERDTEGVPVADIEIDEVGPGESGFMLTGRGADGEHYRLHVHLDIPVDRRTWTVVAELLSQSEIRIWRGSTTPIRDATRRRRNAVG